MSFEKPQIKNPFTYRKPNFSIRNIVRAIFFILVFFTFFLVIFSFTKVLYETKYKPFKVKTNDKNIRTKSTFEAKSEYFSRAFDGNQVKTLFSEIEQFDCGVILTYLFNIHPVLLKQTRPSNSSHSFTSIKPYQLFNCIDNYWQDDHERNSFIQFFKPTLKKQIKGVIILTEYRCGSTFCGELFNQHPDAFYIFEPLKPFKNNTSNTEVNELKLEYLHRYLKCDFPRMREIYESLFDTIPKSFLNQVNLECAFNDFCFRNKIKNLCPHPFCHIPKKSCYNCKPVQLRAAMTTCRNKKVNVVKVIRIYNISDLEPIVRDPLLDVKIIQLVRDPRGVESSRLKLHHNLSISDDSSSLCERMLYTSTFVMKEWLKNRYMLVRYEDLASNPVEGAKSLYNFSGLKFNNIIQKWIEVNTNSVDKQQHKLPFQTNRNSSAALQSWRTHLNYSQVQVIQNICSESMKNLNYKLVSSQNELTNMSLRLH